MKRAVDQVIVRAESDVADARRNLFATVGTIRHRIDPRVIVAEAAESTLARANSLIHDAGNGVRDHKFAVSSGAAAFALAVAMRIWMGRDHGDPDSKPEDKRDVQIPDDIPSPGA